MDVPLKHIVGTIALTGLVISVSLAYTIITSYIEADVTRKQLEQIAEYVSLNLVEIVNLANYMNFGNATLSKTLKLPSDLGGRAYFIELVNESSQEQGYYVYVQLVTRTDISARSLIPLNSTQTRLQLRTDELVYGGTQEIRDENGQILRYRSIVVWGSKDWVEERNEFVEVIEAGIEAREY